MLSMLKEILYSNSLGSQAFVSEGGEATLHDRLSSLVSELTAMKPIDGEG